MAWQPGRSLEDIEKETILQAFGFYHQNKTMTAASLRIAIRTLDAKLDKYREEAENGKRADEELARKQADELAAWRRQASGQPAEDKTNGDSAERACDLESASQGAEKRPVPVRKREKV